MSEVPTNIHSKSNNKYLKSYDTKQESKHFMYLDANNLYGCALCKFLSTSRFKWIDPKEFDLNKYTGNSPEEYVLEVALEYPKELQELHNDYPLASDKIEIKRKMMSDCKLKFVDFDNIPIGNIKKLMPNNFNNEKYVFRY